MVIAVGGIKGGSGKTTVATSLAVVRATGGRRVLLIDADPQGTAMDFSAVRDRSSAATARYATVQLLGRELKDEAPRLLRRYDDVIFDTDGQDVESQRSAMEVADVALVPFIPRSFDFWTLDRVIKRIEKARVANRRLRACAFLNRVDVRRSTNDDAEEVLGESGVLEVLDVRLGSRKAFAAAAALGLAVTELRPPDAKAVREVTALSRCVFQDAGTDQRVSSGPTRR
jgi:chromosome partitioning protein